MVKVSDPEGETVTHRSLYKFLILNNLKISHIRKLLINPLGEPNSSLTCGIGNCKTKFHTLRRRNFGAIAKTRLVNFAEETRKKLGLHVLGTSLQKLVKK